MTSVDTALIIAAGRGSRLADGTEIPKPLKKVCGLTLLKRTILSLARAGLKEVLVVVGYDKQKIIDYLQSESWPIAVRTIDNPQWEKSNGLSVLAAKNHIQGHFLLLMSDHIFDVAIVRNLMWHELCADAVALAVDYHVSEIFDIDDATKVEAAKGRIRKIGKTLPGYNAIDTGIFLMSPDVFVTLEEVARERGDCSISDGMTRLATADRVAALDIGRSYWQDVDTPEALRQAEKVLLNSCRKATDGFVSRYFNRYISLFLTRYIIRTPLSANFVTLITTLIGLLSGYFAACGTFGTYLFGAFLFKLTSILDGVDGEMSRLRFSDSKMGQWLDTLSDNLTYVVFIVGTVIGVFKRPELAVPNWIPYSALLGLTGLLIFMFGYILLFTNSGSLLAVQNDIVKSPKKSFLQKVIGKIYFVIKRDFFATAFLFFALFDKPHWILLAIAVATNVAWISLLVNVLKKRSERKA